MLPASALAYVVAVAITGAGLIAAAALDWGTPDYARLAGYAMLAMWASVLKVKVPGLNGTFSPGFIVLLVAATELNWSETIALAAFSAAVQCLKSSKPKPVQLAFNTACLIIGAAGAYFLSHTLIPEGGQNPALARIALAVVALFLLNTLQVAGVIGLVEKRNPLAVWKQCHLWTFPHYAPGAVIACGLVFTASATGVSAPYLAMPMVYLQHAHYAEFAQRWAG